VCVYVCVHACVCVCVRECVCVCVCAGPQDSTWVQFHVASLPSLLVCAGVAARPPQRTCPSTWVHCAHIPTHPCSELQARWLWCDAPPPLLMSCRLLRSSSSTTARRPSRTRPLAPGRSWVRRCPCTPWATPR